MEILAITSDPAFNYFASIGIYWAFLLGGFFAITTLFRS